MTKAKKPAAKKPANGAAKPPGVIDTVIDCISKEKGSTVDETLAVLVKKFPDRDPDGMRKTAMIQSNKQRTSKEAVDDRGTVFYKRR
jgi:hypothetical protein